jgi:lambda family phage portal protein
MTDRATLWVRLLRRFGLLPNGQGRRTYYAAARVDRLLADWIASPLASAQDEWRADAARIRARARQAVRDDPIFGRYLQLMGDQVVGEGIRVQMRVYRTDGSLAEDVSRTLGTQWLDWAEAPVDTEGMLVFAEVLRRALALTLMDGEAFLRLVPQDGWLRLQFIDPDRIDPNYHVSRLPSGGAVVHGIELDAWGKPVAYHVLADPLVQQSRRMRLPAGEVLHLFTPLRPGQVRGISQFAAVLPLAHLLHGYREAEVIAARTAASKMAFIKQDAFGGVPDETTYQDRPIEAAPGAIERLAPGEDITFWSPEHPTQAYEAFSLQLKNDIASGLHHSYVTLYGDWSRTNYSSGRMPVYQERAYYRAWQRRLIVALAIPILERWLELGQLSGRLTTQVDPARTARDARWIPRSWPLFEPATDVQVLRELLALRLTSESQLAGELGQDWEDILEQRQRDRLMAAEYGERPETP